MTDSLLDFRIYANLYKLAFKLADIIIASVKLSFAQCYVKKLRTFFWFGIKNEENIWAMYFYKIHEVFSTHKRK